MTPPAPTPRFRLLTIADLLKRPDPIDIIADVIPQGGAGMLFGRWGTGKSFLALDWALTIAAGGEDAKWFDHAVTPGPVVYVVAEGQAAFHRRVGAWLAAHDTKTVERIRFIYDAVQLVSSDQVDPVALVQAIQAWEPHPLLVILDTYHACTPGAEENSAKDTGLAIQSLNYIRRETGAAVELLHPPPKSGSGSRGSSALEASMDIVHKLVVDDIDQELLTLIWHKVKDGVKCPSLHFRLRARDTSAIIVPLERESGSEPPPSCQAALTAIRSLAVPGAPLSMKQWKTASGLPERTLMRARKYLLAHGDVVQVKGPKYLPAELVDRPPDQLELAAHAVA